jgi:hypothetical protein
MKFTVEVKHHPPKESPHTVIVTMDKDVIGSLIRALERLQSGTPGEHLHFMSEEWGMSDLTIEVAERNSDPIPHLEIRLRS